MAQRIHKSNLGLDCEASLATRFSGYQLSCLHCRIAYIDCRLRRIPAGACFLKIFGLISKFFQFKLSMVELYLSSEVSFQELALSQGISNPSLIVKWVNDFRIAGPDALRPKKKGRKKTLDIRECKKPSKYDGEKPVDTSAEHVKELEDELLKLRIENAYLKELRRLRLEEETLLKIRRESSTVSEDSST